MARTGGEITKKRILDTAEMIFSQKGYDGTSIQEISVAASVNKALIYYHFKNKQDIIDSLFKRTIDEMFDMQGDPPTQIEHNQQLSQSKEKIAGIITFLESKKKILAVMLMEALKNDKTGHFSLFECANAIISKQVTEVIHKHTRNDKKSSCQKEFLMHEFFTGFLPIVFFALFKDKWADFFKCDRNEMMTIFTKIFMESHIQHD